MSDQTARAKRHAEMVCWYDPGQLLHTARRVIESSLIAESTDPRHMQALETPDAAGEPFTKLRERKELVIDFVADVGDGYASTFGVACGMEAPELPLAGGLRRADLVVLGGDQVYPTASQKAYRERFAPPFEDANAKVPGEARAAFVIPGNHDWYDSLVAFRAFFCGEGGQVGSLQFPQRRSYFALALPHRVWLLGVDFQLDHDIDLPQLEHFERIVATMREGDRVVLCVPEPIWVHDFEQLMATAGSNPDGLDSMMRGEHPRLHTLLDALSSRGARPVAWLSGDLHHYRRHERGSVQHFTAGGGGAFTHPTHGWRDEGHPYAVQPTSYPSTRESFWLTFGNIAFLRKNWKFGLFTGAVYALVFMTLSSTLMGTKQLSLLAGLGTSFVSALDQPSAVLLIALTYLGFFAFTDTRGKWFRGVATLLHGSAHLGSALLLGLGASHFISIGREGPAEWFVRLVEKLTQTFALWASGFFVGPLIMGLYLLISLNLFRRHRNEAFSALRIADFGHFLRIVLAQDGSVTVHAVATPRTGEPRLIESVRLSD